MTADNERFWHAYAKGVKRLNAVPSAEPDCQPPHPRPSHDQALSPSFAPELSPPVIRPSAYSPVDAATTPLLSPIRTLLDQRIERNLLHGDVLLEARLDLHGLTLQEGHEALCVFIEKQYSRGKRVVLVITGKGQTHTESSLRADVPRWCESMPLIGHVQAIRAAAPHHGGEGAWYFVLRKRQGS